MAKSDWTGQTAKQTDDIAVKLRNLNIQLQAANWQIDLV